MRRMFSSRSSALKPRLELSPCRMLSPSRTCATLPRWKSACSRVYATVDCVRRIRGTGWMDTDGVRRDSGSWESPRTRVGMKGGKARTGTERSGKSRRRRLSHLAGAGETGEPEDASLLVHGLLAGGGVHGSLVPLDVGGVADLVGVHVDGGGRGHGDANPALEERGGGSDGVAAGERAGGGGVGGGDLAGEAGELTE